MTQQEKPKGLIERLNDMLDRFDNWLLRLHDKAGVTVSNGYSPSTFEQSSQPGQQIHHVNPANGLPMVNDSFDIHGNSYGTNSMDSHNGL